MREAAKNQNGGPIKAELYDTHDCCPADWRGIKDMTGSFELDGMISRTKNPEMAEKLEDHLTTDVAYRHRTPYNGYSGMS